MKKILALVVLFVVLAGSTYAGYAYWDSLQVVDDTSTITIGEGQFISKTVNVTTATEGKTLVPAGVVKGDNDIYSAVITTTVSLSKAAATDLTLNAVVSNIKIGTETTNAGLVKVVLTYLAVDQLINKGKSVAVTATVTLTEPTTQAIYEAITGKAITFTITFTAA